MAASNIAKKLAEVASKVAYVAFDDRNESQNYSYASARAVLSKVNAEITQRGIAVESNAEVVHYGQEVREGRTGRSHAVVKLILTFVDSESGEKMSVAGLGEGCDSGDKAVMKASTAALKYAFANAFTISWGDDPESDEATDRENRAASAPPPAVDAKKLSTSLKRAISKSGGTEALDKIRAKIIENRDALKSAGLYEDVTTSFQTRVVALRTETEASNA